MHEILGTEISTDGTCARLLLLRQAGSGSRELYVRYLVDREDEELSSMHLDFPFSDLAAYRAHGSETFGLDVDDTAERRVLFGWVGSKVGPEKLAQLAALTGYTPSMRDDDGFVLRWL